MQWYGTELHVCGILQNRVVIVWCWAIGAYHHWSCEFEPCSWWGVLNTTIYVIKFVSDLRQVGGFLRVLWFPPPIKLTATIYKCNWNIVGSGVKHPKPKTNAIFLITDIIIQEANTRTWRRLTKGMYIWEFMNFVRCQTFIFLQPNIVWLK